MVSQSRNFSVPLPTDVEIKYEGSVIQKNFSGYLRRALAWTALTPLFMLAFMHFSQLMNATDINDTRQIEITKQLAGQLSEKLKDFNFFITTVADSFSHDDLDKEWLLRSVDRFPNLLFIKVYGESDHVLWEDSARVFNNIDGFLQQSNKGFVAYKNGDQDIVCSKVQVSSTGSEQIVGCLSFDYLKNLFLTKVGTDPFTLQVFTSTGESIFNTYVNYAKHAQSTVLSQDFIKKANEILLSPRPLWRTEQLRNQAQVFSIAKVEPPGWYLMVGQPVSVRDEQLLSSLQTSGIFLILGLLGTALVGTFLGRKLTANVESVIEQINEFKNHGIIVKYPKDKFDNAPLELKIVSKQFELLADAVVRSQKKLEKVNEDLIDQVNQRTAVLNQRNEELKSLQLLLTPLEEPAAVVIRKTTERFKEILELPVLFFTEHLNKQEDALEKIVVKSSGGEVLGCLCFQTSDIQDKNIVLNALERLARSISIVLDNENMFRSIKIDHSRFTSLMESMTEGVILVGLTGSLLYSNNTAASLLGISEGTTIDNVENHINKYFRPIGSEETVKESGIQNKYASKTNSDLFLEISSFIVPHFYGYGKRTGYIVRDISKEMSIERMKKNLISVVAHELKTPITTMRLQAETIFRSFRNNPSESTMELLSDMLDESNRLQNLISDWLDVSRIESGAMVIKPKLYPLTTLLSSALKIVQQHYPDLSVERKLSEDAQCILADKDRILQVFINILENAARYRSARKPLCIVESKIVNEEIEISFRDNGIGIPETHLSRVFDTFYQVDMSNSRRVGGTGLGLAICRGIMTAHGGRIWAEGNPSGGTVIKLCFKL